MNYCKFKKRECPEVIEAEGSVSSVWSYITRLSNYGGSPDPIDTRHIGQDYTFKQCSPEECAKTYSARRVTKLLLFPATVHSCDKCRESIRSVLEKLGIAK